MPGSRLSGLCILFLGSPQANAVAPYYSKLCFTPESHDLAATSWAGDLLPKYGLEPEELEKPEGVFTGWLL